MIFGKPASTAAPADRLDMIFEKVPRGAGKFNSLKKVNGNSIRMSRSLLLKQGNSLPADFP